MLPSAIQKVIDHFSRLPGIGQKTAERLAFYLLKEKPHFLDNFGNDLKALHSNLVFCENCHNLSEEPLCIICKNVKRDQTTLCVVEEVLDIIAFEKSDSYQGVYHVLQGVISPVNGIGPQDLTIETLKNRLINSEIQEIILATNPTIEGEATALYLYKILQPLNLKITRIARGLPTGSDLGYADKLTLSNCLKGRQAI